METQLTDLSAEVTGVRLAECLGALGEYADEEIDPAEVAISETFKPRSHLGLNFDLAQIGHASNGICI